MIRRGCRFDEANDATADKADVADKPAEAVEADPTYVFLSELLVGGFVMEEGWKGCGGGVRFDCTSYSTAPVDLKLTGLFSGPVGALDRPDDAVGDVTGCLEDAECWVAGACP